MRNIYRVSIQSINGHNYYVCPWCYWLFFSKAYIDGHVGACLARPEAYSCATCGNRKCVDDDKWVCGENITSGELFGPNGNAISQCHRWFDGQWGEDDYYGRVLKVGDEFRPKGFNKKYRIEEVIK